jgi:hypothetical protein
VVWGFSRPNLAGPLRVLFQFGLSSGIKFSTSVLYIIRSTQRVFGDGLGHPIAHTGCRWRGARTPIAIRTTASEFNPMAPALESAFCGFGFVLRPTTTTPLGILCTAMADFNGQSRRPDASSIYKTMHGIQFARMHVSYMQDD